jgi:molecular chaperone GrpE (heat shock protein)
MTRDEKHADAHLMKTKEEVKEAFRLLDPYAKEPLATALLKTLDTIDRARKALKERMPT